MAITYDVRGDETVLIGSIRGSLALEDVSSLHVNLLKSLAEQPTALLLDLSAMHVTDPLALSVFSATTRQAARWPETPVLLFGPPPPTRELLNGSAYRRLIVLGGLAEARARLAEDPGAGPRVFEELLPVRGAARHARDLATDACLRWDLPHLAGPASLIANELVGNVVDHAHTMMTLRLSLLPRYLTVAVRDGSPVEVRLPVDVPLDARRGRGLMLVDATAHAWGCVLTADGKVVWASLRR
ncbi:ATPase [Actinoplanes sp. TRM 88003]|uniref:ATPase n=1 Tax=Paractinoplanes aksuensis TaxID=2939490 RepID=A0ABT1DGS9_9ACTN|nr:ATPase [Actinoplanes aksuensis]MCO8270032.1 ATPase [Actinoplanes aksuensis]